MKLFLSCEHGGNLVPKQYANLFLKSTDILNTHRGWDIGALELFNVLNRYIIHYSIYSETTRLLVDLNRSLHKRTLFSEFSKHLNGNEKQQVLAHYYHPFRDSFITKAREVANSQEHIFHISVHSFTPVLNGETRNADIGLLYNPKHGREQHIAKLWKEELNKVLPEFKIRFNYPYLGKTDGFVALLRKELGPIYSGIELELNNKHSYNNQVNEAISESYKSLVSRLLF
jgi:predicted N-formylglutamate amidohydrolase